MGWKSYTGGDFRMAAPTRPYSDGSSRIVLGAGTSPLSASALMILGRRMGKHYSGFQYLRRLIVEGEALQDAALATGIMVSELYDKAVKLQEETDFNFIEALLWIKFRVSNGYCPVCLEHQVYERCPVEQSDT